MTLEKMKYQLKDWYQGTEPYYVGKTIEGMKGKITNYAISSSAEEIWFEKYDPTDSYAEASTLNASQINGKKVLFQIYWHIAHATYVEPNTVFLGFILKSVHDSQRDQYNDITCWVKLADILQNGGVSSSPLTHLYQAFRGLLRKQVVVC